jgi:hypothetical protein
MNTSFPPIHDTEGLPEELHGQAPLWETYHSATSRRAHIGFRLYDDGRLFRYANSHIVWQDELPVKQEAPFQWRLEGRLSPEGLQEIQSLLEGPFSQLSGQEAAEGKHQDRGWVYRKGKTKEGEKIVRLPVMGHDDLPEAIQKIEYSLQALRVE